MPLFPSGFVLYASLVYNSDGFPSMLILFFIIIIICFLIFFLLKYS